MYIRTATEADLKSIIEIYNSTIDSRIATADTEAVSLESRLSWFHNRDFNYRPIWVVVWETSNIVAWLSFNNFYGRPAYQNTAEVSIYVAQEYRRQGIGSKLLKQAIKESANLQIKTLLAFIFAHNQPSINLFNRYGFTQWGFFPEVALMDNIERDLIILGMKVRDEGLF